MIYGKILKTSQQEEKYEVQCHLKGKMTKVVVEFDSFRIMPVHFFSNFECVNNDGDHRYQTLIEGDSELFSYDCPLANLN